MCIRDSFRVVDLTRVPKVTEDKRVTGILATMSASSIVEGVNFGEVEGSNILKAVSYTHLYVSYALPVLLVAAGRLSAFRLSQRK